MPGDICNVPGEDDAPFTQVRGRRKRTKKQPGGVQSDNITQPSTSTTINDDRNALANELQNSRSTADIVADITDSSQSTTSVSATVLSEIAELRKSVEQLSVVVSNQKATIDNLHNKLKFVLSFLDITDCGPDSVSLDTAAATNVVEGTLQQASVAVDRSSTSDAGINATAQQPSQPSIKSATYASATSVNREGGGFGPASNLRHAVAAVVYADQRVKEKRAKTVVVSGLATSQVDGDALISQWLCMLEFGVDPSITYTRRLGAAGGDRVRPLLVGLQSVGDVSVVLSQAKKLRTSANEVTCNSVYINRNLTKVEERLAYEERCRRRNRLPTTNQTETTSTRRYERPLPSPSQSAVATTSASPSGRPR